LNEIIRWMKSQCESIILQFKVNLYGYSINHEDINEFLNANRIFELKVQGITSQLPLSMSQRLRYLIIWDNSSQLIYLE
jgi:hypothetical protein